jgi:cation diffusion facilitator family transporter
VAIVVILVGAAIIYNSVSSLATQEKFVAPEWWALLVCGASMVGKEALFQYKVRVARQLASTSLEADAWHHRSDAISSIPVFIGIGAAILGGERLHFMDHAAAIIAGIVIIWVGVSLFRKSWAELMDTAAPEKTLDELRKITLNVSEVKGVEKIFSRKAGLDVFVDIHVEVAPEKTVLEGHDIATAVRAAIMEKMPAVRGVLVHIEPYGVPKTAAQPASLYDIIWPNFGC